MENIKESPLIFDNGFARLYHADARSLPIDDESVDCVVTSPPYWGLRDYGLGEWEGGNNDCSHERRLARNDAKRENTQGFHGSSRDDSDKGAIQYTGTCPLCGAIRVDNGIGLEPTPEAYCANMVKVFREVWRVLKPTGTVWMNLGDSYSSGGRTTTTNDSFRGDTIVNTVRTPVVKGIKPKDLVGIPWRVAFALQADGWYLRSDIIWSKPNPMPESVTDRPTKAHEYIFLLTKSPTYYYDADAIREPAQNWGIRDRTNGKYHNEGTGLTHHSGLTDSNHAESGRNKRTVWEIATQPYPEAHFATFPEDLVEPCILAGSSEKGVCAQCGKPWERIVVASGGTIGKGWNDHTNDMVRGMRDESHGKSTDGTYKRTDMGWEPTCTCNADVVPATVLDPFAGSGTTMAVAQKFGRKSVGTDLSREYLDLATKRLGSIPFPLLL
jgi:DNA modification methylase